MSVEKLKNTPLLEVIFELRWDDGVVISGAPNDVGFDLAQGKFDGKIKPEFPLHRKLVRVFFGPEHQYWKGEFKWPVIQHGQGMMAVNDIGQNYEWVNYKPLVLNSINKLIESYENELSFKNAKLQYINSWDLDGNDFLGFVEKNLQTRILTDYRAPGSLKGFSMQQTFQLEDLSLMNLNIANGVNNQNQKKTIVETTTVQKLTSLSLTEIEIWMEKAHSAASEIFKKMLTTEFYATFD